MRERLLVALALGALLAAMVPAAAAAEEVPGRPGRFEVAINIGTEPWPYCYAVYLDPTPYVEPESNVGTDWEGYATVHVVENKKGKVKATCKTIDISGVWESNAEVGYSTDCYLETADGAWSGGKGKMVAAANTPSCPDDEEPCSNATMTCKFDEDDQVP